MNTPEWHEFNGVTWTVDELEELRKIGEIISKRAEETLPLINNFLQKTPRGIHACAIGCLFLEIVDKPLKCTSDSLVSKAKKKFTVLTKPLWRDSPRQKGSHTRELNIILIITEMNDAGIDRSLTPVHWFFYEEEEPDHQDEDLITVYIGDLFLLTKPYNSICEIS